MAVSARSWFHFGTAIGWFPAALNPFSPTAIGGASLQWPTSDRELHEQTLFDVLLEATALQFRPLDASQTRSSGQLMLLIDGAVQRNPGQPSIFAMVFGQLMVPRAATRWSL